MATGWKLHYCNLWQSILDVSANSIRMYVCVQNYFNGYANQILKDHWVKNMGHEAEHIQSVLLNQIHKI